ncbi:M56 family metallopeptidase [Vescimonas sp.]|uniref:M56 family metallopeptidase n=1 Tax=Vescimonas sp. TaxID=2892404 RepID=UPI003F7DAB96
MDKLFDTVLELSWQAGLIALAVMAVRLVLRKKASRRALCMLWALVALRLLLPVSLTVESPVSLQAEEAPVSRVYHAMQEARTSVPEEAAPAPAESSGAAAAVVPTEPAAEPVTLRTFARWLPWIWVIGMGCMAAYMLLSFIWMRLTLRRAEHIQDNVYRCTQWSTPFVLGIIAPCIYVPESVSEEDLPQVLAHERCHIRRWDHVVKPFAFLLLAVNWFNPVLWAAYVLLGRDMENACDEMALKNADTAQRAAYSRALVSCAAQPKMAAVCPLAFGEVAVKERVKNVLGYKKPAIWAAVILAAAAVVIGVCLLTKPSYKNVGTLDAEKLFALRTPYVDNNSAVGAILDALGFRELGSSGADYGYAVHLSTDREPMGITVLYTYEGAVPRKSEERYRQIAMRGYIALALIDNAEWFSWQEHGADGTSNKADSTASDSLYPIVYPGYPDTVRESAEGLQAYINMLQEWMKDGVVPYVYGESEQRDGWAWNADRLDEYRWKWGLSEAALYDDVMRLGMQTRASMAGYDCRAQITTEEDSTGVDVFLYPMRGDATAEEIDGELATWMRGALHMMLALNDKAQWARFSTVDADNGAHCWGRAFADASAYDIAGARESREGMEKLIKALQDDIERGQVDESFAMMEDGAEMPSAAPASPLGTSGESAYIVKFRRPAAELEVYQITWGAGDSTKQVVPLREEQVQAIQSEKGLVQPEWYQVCAELRQGDEDVAYYMGTDYKPVPPTVLKILTEQCGYTFVTPEDFRGNMTSAKLEFYDGETYTADKADLPALQRMLTNARAYGGGAACGFGAKLTVTFDDGRTVSVLKGTDSCASFTFGSWNTAMVSDSENRQFWQIFGVPFEG